MTWIGTHISIANSTKIAEVHRIVHFLKKHAVGKVVANVKAQEDNVCCTLLCTIADTLLTDSI